MEPSLTPSGPSPEIPRPPRRSPLNGRLASSRGVAREEDGWLVYDAFGETEAEAARAREGVVVADESSNGRIELLGPGAGRALAGVCACGALDIGEGGVREGVRAYRVAEERYLVGTLRGGEEAVLAGLAGAAGCRVRDLTDAWAEIRLVGPASRALLASVCPLDLSPAALPDRGASRGRVLHWEQTVIRRDLGPLPGFSLWGPRAAGIGLWDGLLQAGRTWGAAPIGLAALKELKIVSQIYRELG